jgi:predicted metal-dependent phosphoesterase TrpH
MNKSAVGKNQSDTFLRVEFHAHTIYSKDSLTTPEKLIRTCRRKNIDRVVVTDHNTITGALHCQELAPDLVIVGEEIMTTAGEILAFYVTEEIPPGLSPQETINRLRAQDAFISISHPFDNFRNGAWQHPELLAILPKIDAVETFNARCMFPWHNWKAAKFAQQHNLLGTHGSDAHAAFELGRGSLYLPPFEDAVSLKNSLAKAFSPPLILSMPWVHFTSRYAVWNKKIFRQG